MENDGTIKKGQQEKPANHADGKPGEHDRHANADIADAVKAIHEHLDTANKENSKREERRHKLELAALGVATFYAAITFCLFRSQQSATSAAIDSVRLSHAALLVKADKVGIPPDGLTANKLNTFGFYIDNIGNGIARDMTSICNHDVIDRDAKPTFPLPGAQLRQLILAPGGKALDLPIDIPAEDLSDAPSNNQIAMIDDGRRKLLIYGVVLYNDGFERRCLSFCDRFQPPIGEPGTMHQCETRPDCETTYQDWLGKKEGTLLPSSFEGEATPAHRHQQYEKKSG
jgi:hypothetical protein